ncbi:MAG: protoporphyrinogen oxidase, partial [bacterium]
MRDCIIIGAGISGLSIGARLLLQAPQLETLILERERDVGGTITCHRERGYLADLGPITALYTTPLIGELINFADFEEELVFASENANSRFILRNGELHKLPMKPQNFLTADLFSLKAKLRVALEPFIGKGPDGETISEFVKRRLGREFLDYAIDPFISGVFAGDPEKLELRWALPKIYALEREYGGLLKGAFLGAKKRKKKENIAKDRARLYSFKNGMATWPGAIGLKLGYRIITGCNIISIIKSDNFYTVEYDSPNGTFHEKTRSLIFSLPADSLKKMMHMVDRECEGN